MEELLVVVGLVPSPMAHPIPRVAMVTGANTGIGRATTLELARRGFEVVLAGRSPERIANAADAIRAATGSDHVATLVLDLASFASIRRAAATFLASGRPLHLLINNAGVAGGRGLTADGFELAFGVNHLGHFLLTDLLIDRVVESAPARIINVSSRGHYRARGVDFEAVTRRTRSLTGVPEYRTSKLANVLFTRELARRHRPASVSAYALDPGLVATDVWRRIPSPIRALVTRSMASPEVGAQTTLRLATSPDVANESGGYYVDRLLREPNPLARDEALAQELWRRSAQWVRG
jgi:retinol dehydrogenase 12